MAAMQAHSVFLFLSFFAACVRRWHAKLIALGVSLSSGEGSAIRAATLQPHFSMKSNETGRKKDEEKCINQ